MRRWFLALSPLALGGVLGLLAAGTFLHGQPPAPAAPPVVPKELTSFRDVVKKVLPAVVSIESHAKTQPAGRNRPGADDSGDDDELGFGSGFLIDPKGVVLTNFHVVEG